MTFKEKLIKQYKSETEQASLGNVSVLAFIGDYVFDFTTYDYEISEIMATNMLEVIDSILSCTASEYIKDKNNYLNFISMINMPFLNDKIEWGCSVRNCWLDSDPFSIGLNNPIKIKQNEVKIFFKELIEWSNYKTK